MSRILDTILPESVHNEGLLFVPQVLEDLMRGKLDAEFPPKLDEGDDPASVRAFVFDRAKRLWASFIESSAQTNVDAVTRKFVVNLLDNALGWDFDKPAAVAEKTGAFLVSPVLGDAEGALTPSAFPVILAPHTIGLDESNPRFHGWGLSDASRSATCFAQEFLNERDDFMWAIVTNGKELRLGYQHVMTPCVGTVDLYRTSGHWEHYKENMFPPMVMEGEEYVLRPMNCPHQADELPASHADLRQPAQILQEPSAAHSRDRP